MTLIVSWAAYDTKGHKRGAAATYLMSDSRISWNATDKWDKARKTFNFSEHPDVIGYCGDVLFPSQVLSQIITLGDAGLLFEKDSDFPVKSEAIFKVIKEMFDDYPHGQLYPSFKIIHTGKKLKGVFGCSVLSWDQLNGWQELPAPLPADTGLIFAAGSGAVEFKENYYAKFNGTDLIKSRDIYQLFIETLGNIKDPACGGPPQLAGVYLGDMTRTFGIIANEKRYAIGLELADDAIFGDFEWRNELFERCNPSTKNRLPQAQRQPKMP